jgi:general stress protein 26
MTSSQATFQLRKLIGDADVAMLASGAPSGEIHSRPLMLAEVNDEGNLVFLVDGTAEWVTGLRAEDQVNVAITNDDDKTWVSVSGATRITEDKATLDRLWTKAAEAFFPDGIDSPQLRILNVLTTSAEYWDASSSRVQRLAVMITSLVGDRSAKLAQSGSIDLH